MIKEITDFSTIEEGTKRLEKMVKLREHEKDTIFYDIWQKDCKKFADKLITAGADKEDILTIMNWTNKKDCYCGVIWREKE